MSNTRKKEKNIKKKKGFTLIELLAVIVVLGIVAGVSIVIYTGVKEKSEGKITEASKDNILSSSKDYASEYLQDDKIWAPADSETLDGTTVSRDIYCITVKNLLDKGFLKKDLPSGVKPDNIIAIYKDENGKITPNFSDSDDICKGQLPEINISIISTPNDKGNYDEKVDFKLSLSDIGEFDGFYYSINGGEDIQCDISKRECIGSVSGIYGNVNIKGVVARGSKKASKDINVKIDEVKPDIEFVANGTKGNDNWYTSDVKVSVKVNKAGTNNAMDSSLYTLNGLCASTNNSECSNFSGTSVTAKEINSGKKVCAKITTKGGSVVTKCTSYKIDTSVPTVTLSGDYNDSTGTIDVYGTFAEDISGLTVMGIYDSDITYDACDNPRRDYFKDITKTSNVLIDSYSNNRDKSIWLKDKAGNCGKVISYYVHLNKTGWTSTKTDIPLTTTIFPNYRVKKLIFAKGIIDSGRVTYHVYTDAELKAEGDADNTTYKAGIKFSYYNPVKESCTTSTTTCSRRADSYSADYEETCTSYSSNPCPYGGKRSGSRCVANYGSSYIGSTNCTGNFQCSCKNGNCWWTYARTPSCSYNKVYSDGSCYDGYSGYGITNTNPSQTSCSVSQANTWKNNWSYRYEAKCTWQGNYDATCSRYSKGYSCDDDDYLSGSTCYYCLGRNETLSGRYCEYECSGTEVCKYRYSKYALMYIIDD